MSDSIIFCFSRFVIRGFFEEEEEAVAPEVPALEVLKVAEVLAEVLLDALEAAPEKAAAAFLFRAATPLPPEVEDFSCCW